MIQDVYDDYLYDCYLANKQLTYYEWEVYGCEEHHVEIPERDGGKLTDLNKQPLTTFQHWVAGVLQSELLGKCCFACVPKGKLPAKVEALRDKWQREYAKERFAETGHRIAQKGKRWINNGTENKMVAKDYQLPLGWDYGRLPFTEEHKKNISNSGKGRVITEETREKLKARPNAWFGRKHTEESKQKMREAKLRGKNDQ
jgi:hypothetical protein